MAYNIIGADAASRATFDAPKGTSINTQISYNRATGEVITTEHASLEDWTRYNSPDIVTICYINRHMSADAIKAAIIDTMRKIDSI